MKYLMFALLSALLFAGPSHAGDGYQDRPSVCANMTDKAHSDRCHFWVERVRVPGTENRCCGDGDTYIADKWEMIDGELWMTITVDYPLVAYTDEEGNPVTPPPGAFVPKKGTPIHIPKDRIVTRFEDANQSTHSVFFASSSGTIYCAILGALI